MCKISIYSRNLEVNTFKLQYEKKHLNKEYNVHNVQDLLRACPRLLLGVTDT